MQPVAEMATPRAHTIADIARLAGVSKSTVSRALNDSPLIGPETKERIRAIAREHRFQMNAPARRLSLKRSNAIALVSYEYSAESAVPDAFMLELMSGISSALRENDYDLLVVHISPSDTEWVHRYIDTGRVAGFILLSATCTARHLTTLAESNAPFIVWGVPTGVHGGSSVSGDSVAGGRIATEHLLRTGKSRIAFLGGPERDPEVEARFRGYEAALADAGRAVDAALVTYGKWLQPDTSGSEAMRRLLERAPDLDGVFANSDLLAIAAMDTLREHGRRVPDDVGVVGYDDVSVARHCNPPLTTIRQNGPLAGRLLAENLIQQLRTGAVTNVTLPAELVLRKSS
jgi:DNA-binding LacI/PurR family transcriptional regulator